MEFRDNEEQSLLRSSARRFAEAPGFSGDRRLAAPSEPSTRWQDLAQLGWLGIPLPEDVGGLALSPIEIAILMEEFGRGLVVEPFVSTVLSGALLIDRLGDAAQRKALLPRVIAGELTLALAHEEAGTRGSLDAVTTKAVQHGNDWMLTGRKRAVLGAPSAETILVSAQVQGKGISLFLLDPDSPGVSTVAYRTIDGFSAADIVLDNVRCIPLGKPGAAATLADLLDEIGVALAAEALGGMERVTALTVDYLKSRRQFGQPLAGFQVLRHRVAEMAGELEMARSALHYGLWGLAQTDNAQRRRAAAGAAARVLRAGRFICESGIQLHGGVGMTDASEVGHHYRRFLAIDAILGGEDALEQRILATQSNAQG